MNGERPYCRAYQLRDVRRFAGWTEPVPAEAETPTADLLSDDSVVFLHRDCSVTRTIWPREAILFAGGSEEWLRFCRDTLQFDPDSFAA
jgi:hypothetical protein